MFKSCKLKEVNSENSDSDDDPLALALRSLRFLSALKDTRSFILI